MLNKLSFNLASSLNESETEAYKIKNKVFTENSYLNENKINEEITVEEITRIHNAIEDAIDEDEIQEIIYNISDGVLEDEVQRAFDQSIQDEDDLDTLKGFVITTLEDNAEYLDEAAPIDKKEKEDRLASVKTQLDKDGDQLANDEKEALNQEAVDLEKELNEEEKIVWTSEVDTSEEAYNAAYEGWDDDEKPSYEDWLNSDFDAETDFIIQDLNEFVLPEIEKQVNDGLLFIVGNYNSNYPDFRPSGGGAVTLKGTEGLKNYLTRWDEIKITSENGELNIRAYDHDGSVSGTLCTVINDRNKILEELGYYKDYEDKNEAESEYENDLYYEGVDYKSFAEHPDLIIPIKNTITEAKENACKEKLNEGRNLEDEFNALSKEEQEKYLELRPENGNDRVNPEIINDLAKKYNVDKDILYWVINIKGNINESEEHNLSKDLFGAEAERRLSQERKDLQKDLQYVRDIMAGKEVIDDIYHEKLSLDTAKKWLRKDFVNVNCLASADPDDIDKKLAQEYPDIFGNSLSESITKYNLLTIDKEGNEVLLSNTSYNKACNWLSNELKKNNFEIVGAKTLDTDKIIIKTNSGINYVYSEKEGSLKKLKESEEADKVEVDKDGNKSVRDEKTGHLKRIQVSKKTQDKMADKYNKKQELKEDTIPNSFNTPCPKCGSNNFVEIDDEEDSDGTQHFHLTCQDCGYTEENEYNPLEEDADEKEYKKRMNKTFKSFCNSMELNPNDLDDVLWALDELEGQFGDETGEYQELREYIYNELLNESKEIEENMKEVRKDSIEKGLLTETGEWDESDDDLIAWKEALKTAAEEIAKNIDGEVKIVKGFDKYQGPFAIIATPKYGDIELWSGPEEDLLDAKVAHVGWIEGSTSEISELLNMDTIPEERLISESLEEIDTRTYDDEDEAAYYRNKELYSTSHLTRHKEAMEKAKKACEDKNIKLEENEKTPIVEAEVKGLKTVKSQGNIFMLEDETKKIIVGENYNESEGLIENAEIYNNKEEANKDYLGRCDIIGGTQEDK